MKEWELMNIALQSTKLKQGIQSEDGCEKGDEKGDEKGCEKGGRTPGKRWSVGRCVREFSESTSMHGVARVGDSRSPVLLRLFWFLLVLTAAGWSGYNVALITLNYLRRPVSTVVSVEYEENIPFPAVTLCNLNQLRASRFYEYFEELGGRSVPLKGESSTAGPSSTATPPDVNVTVGSGGPDSNDFISFDEFINTYYRRVSSMKPFLDTVGRKRRERLSHQMADMLIDCQYQLHSCSDSNFTQFWNLDYGNCFTFNKDLEADNVSRSGPLHGLSLLLNLETDEYLKFTETVGMKLVIHPSDAMPFPEDEGIIVAPGFASSIGLRRIDIKRTPFPYGRCYDYTETDNLQVNMYAEEFDVGYTDKACQRSTLQWCIIKVCECCDLDYPCIRGGTVKRSSPGSNATSNGNRNRVPYCDMDDRKQSDCVGEIRNRFKHDHLECKADCLPSCRETLYEQEVSMGLWPSEVATKRLNRIFRNKLQESFGSGNLSQDFIRKHLVKVDIFFKQLNYEQLVTMPAYDWSRLLSDLGGQLGLWMGFSMLTAVELLGLAVELVRNTVLKAVGRNAGNKVTMTSSRNDLKH